MANFDIALIENSTPLPAALPMFVGGLGVLSLLARKRKENRKKSTARAAA